MIQWIIPDNNKWFLSGYDSTFKLILVEKYTQSLNVTSACLFVPYLLDKFHNVTKMSNFIWYTNSQKVKNVIDSILILIIVTFYLPGKHLKFVVFVTVFV